MTAFWCGCSFLRVPAAPAACRVAGETTWGDHGEATRGEHVETTAEDHGETTAGDHGETTGDVPAAPATCRVKRLGAQGSGLKI